MLIEMREKSAVTQRTRQRDVTRRQLVEAGLRVVAVSGFAGASTAAIAQETGKAHGTVFLHFRTRDALVAELVAEIGRGMSSRLTELESVAPNLSEVMDAHLKTLGENEVLYSRLLGEASTLPLAARAYIFALQSGIASRLRDAYLRQRARAEVREIDPVTLANLWISLSNHYLLNRDLFAPGTSVIAKCGAQLKAQVLDLMRPCKETL